MLIVKTPFRVSFVGGGTDVPGYYSSRPGAVLSCAIRQYMYIVIHPYLNRSFDLQKIRLKYSETEDVSDVQEIRHPLIREALKYCSLPTGIEIASFADIPAGTGLGSSSSFLVGLLHALHAWKGESISKHELASLACKIEMEILGKPVGKQDQFAAAYGGMNRFDFLPNGEVKASPIDMSEKFQKELESRLALYYLGDQRSADEILEKQNSTETQTKKAVVLDKMRAQVDVLETQFRENDIGGLGAILSEAWEYKRGLAQGITNAKVNNYYDKGIQSGANGGKLLGAGGTGFLLMDSNDPIALGKNLGLATIPLEIDLGGSRVIYQEK